MTARKSVAAMHWLHPGLAARTAKTHSSPEEGGGAPNGASNQRPRRAFRCRHLKTLRARLRSWRGPLALRRSTAALAGGLIPAQLRAVFPGTAKSERAL